MQNIATIDPFYASRLKRVAPRHEEPDRPVYARLPLAPRNGSPVPHLTSLYHFHRAGEYGDRSWPGNCGGNLIKDLLVFFTARPGLRPDEPAAAPAATFAEELGIPCMAWDIHQGIRRLRPARISRRRDVRFHLGTPALLAA